MLTLCVDLLPPWRQDRRRIESRLERNLISPQLQFIYHFSVCVCVCYDIESSVLQCNNTYRYCSFDCFFVSFSSFKL